MQRTDWQLSEGKKARDWVRDEKGGSGKNKQTNLMYTDNSKVVTRGEGGPVEEGKGRINGDKRRLEFGW